MKVYKYIFEDGYFCYTSGKMDKMDLYHTIRKHGKLISKTLA